MADQPGAVPVPVPPAETSSSRYVMQSASTVHNFVVTSYSRLDGMAADKKVTSSRFHAGGFSWVIDFYPDGNGTMSEGDAPHASAYLILCSEGGNGCEGKLKGYDEFTVRCELTVIHDEFTEDVGPVKVPVPPSTTRRQLAKMLKDGIGVDVALSVGGRLFRAHRWLLAAESPVFMAQLFGEMNANTDAQKLIKVVDVEPSVFEALLHFVYTDTLPPGMMELVGRNTAEVQHLLVAADRYGMDRLKAMCEEKLCRSIDVQTVGFVLALADQHSCLHLKRACMDFITSSFNAVKETEGFKHLKESCPWLISEMLDKKAAALKG